MTKPSRRGSNRWIDTETGFIGAAWFWPPQTEAASTAVVIVPGIAHEERTMNGGLVALAESLADAGLPALLMELHGCAQSAGYLDDTNVVACWHAGMRAAVQHARDSGARRVIVVGVRLGALLAAEALAHEPLEAFIAWAPIVSGRRYVRELRLLRRVTDAENAATGMIEIGGFGIPAAVLEHISCLDLAQIETLNAPHVLLRERSESLNAPWLARLGDCGKVVQEQASAQIRPWLFSSSDSPILPMEDIKALTKWCRALTDGRPVDVHPSPRQPATCPTVEFVHQGRRVRETFVEIGSNGLTGVLSEPADGAHKHAVRLLVSTVGPGRTFTNFARDEAGRGNTSLRFDFAGFGTSGRGAAMQGGELNTNQGSRDVLAAIEYLRNAGHHQIYALGFCAGGWSLMQAEVAPELRALVAINVALYRQPIAGGPGLLDEAGRQRGGVLSALAQRPLAQRITTRLIRALGKRREPIEWLSRLCSADVRVLLAYADLDPGLEYLNSQLAKGLAEQLRQPFRLQVYAGLGHLAEGPLARARLFQDIAEFFADLDRHCSLAAPRSIDLTCVGPGATPNQYRAECELADRDS